MDMCLSKVSRLDPRQHTSVNKGIPSVALQCVPVALMENGPMNNRLVTVRKQPIATYIAEFTCTHQQLPLIV